MITKVRFISILFLAISFGFMGCVKDKYSFGDIKTPTGLTLTTAVEGIDADNPGGNGSGNVAVTVNAADALTYKVNFGDGNSAMVPGGTITHKYTSPGTFDYTITVNAVGTAGVVSSLSTKIKVFTAFEIPTDIVQLLTDGTSKTWVTARETPGHVGVGPADGFTPSYYSATPNQRDECLYDDEITFTKDANNNIILTIDNKGQSFLIAASTAFYGKSGGDACYDLDVSAPRKLSFMDATSASTPDISTRIQFEVPGNGLINFGTGGNTYEILSISDTQVHLRNIGIDGLAWYQILKAK